MLESKKNSKSKTLTFFFAYKRSIGYVENFTLTFAFKILDKCEQFELDSGKNLFISACLENKSGSNKFKINY